MKFFTPCAFRGLSVHILLFSSLFFCQVFPASVSAEISSHTVSDFSMMPVDTSISEPPKVMIAASNDHQNYFKAYKDYTDLDGDGTIDSTYNHSIDYYGYFDSYKCYAYEQPKADNNTTSLDTNNSGGMSSADYVFVPKLVTEDKYCPSSTLWSGNFLNWISMANIDTTRKMLFGGHRRYDTGNGTVLERTYLPHDAHSWAKHYDGDDLEKLTPFSPGTDYICDQGNPGSCSTPEESGITFCNTTDVQNHTGYSQDIDTAANPPLIKKAVGNYSVWAANERWQCTWASGSPANDNHSNTSNNVTGSGITAYDTYPAYGGDNTQYNARVQVCVDRDDANATSPKNLRTGEKCWHYPDDIYKPVGLLQIYGQTEQLEFGMMGGSYLDHASGGSLIRNIGSMKEEINWDTNGTFKTVADLAGGPVTSPYTSGNPPAARGLINAWSLYRITGYNHSTGTYNDSGSGDDCIWKLSAESDVTSSNRCQNWGNPFSEIYMETIRYLKGDKSLNAQFVSNQTGGSGLPGLPTPQSWTYECTETNGCAPLNIVAFNSSVSSYDEDELDFSGSSKGVTSIWDRATLPGTHDSSSMTDIIGQAEGVHGNRYFIGELDVDVQGDSDDQLCTSKTVNSLGDVGGLCPDAPRLQGSYRVAGVAYYAHAKDINTSIFGDQLVDTFVVSSATAPKIEIPFPSTPTTTAVTLLPACRNTSANPDGNCAIVDFKLVSQVVNNGSGQGTGKLYVNWEDSEQGGDYDQDMWGTIDYVIDDSGANATIAITTDVFAKSTPFLLGFGYVIEGTNNDGFHVHSGINGYSYSEGADSGDDCAGAGGCAHTDGNSTITYTIAQSSTSFLKDPLWYAAKWGGFKNGNGNTINTTGHSGNTLPAPDATSEYDKYDNRTGDETSDGIPDNYFFATNPSEIEAALDRVFQKILQRVSSGTAAAVVSNNVRGDGAIYQAYYEAFRPDALDSSKNAFWIGSLHSLWIDNYGYIREDNAPKGTLDDYDTDYVVLTNYNETTATTEVYRFPSSDNATFTAIDQTGETNCWPDNWDKCKTIDASNTIQDASVSVPFEDLGVLWNARDKLSEVSSHVPQRTYNSPLNERFIKTWIDIDLDGIVDSGEYIDFTSNSISGVTSADYAGYFDLHDGTTASSNANTDKLIKFVRGVDPDDDASLSSFRSRKILYSASDAAKKVLRLGDMVNSTPTVVGSPLEAFDKLYQDTSYKDFYRRYKNRRSVIYAGANDGMIHAFNAGFFDEDTLTINTTDGDPSTIPYELGSELWAYVPFNLLPHLKWLTDIDYSPHNSQHVSYVDLKPRIFDAKIFEAEEATETCSSLGTDDPGCIHPNGWGTVMIIGMGMGGGAMTVDVTGDGLGSNDHTMSSAYIMFDITNPEEEPTLLAEFQVPDGSFSMVYPAVLAQKDSVDWDTDSSNDMDKWFLVFGSGPKPNYETLRDKHLYSYTNGVDGDSDAFLYLVDLDELKDPVSTANPSFTNYLSTDYTNTCTPDCEFAKGANKCNSTTRKQCLSYCETLVSNNLSFIQCDTNTADTFIGTPVVVDWELDYKGDMIYFGLVGDTDATTGKVFRLPINSPDASNSYATTSSTPIPTPPYDFMSTSGSVTAQITPGLDEHDNKWLFWGTGRKYTNTDSTALQQQTPNLRTFYGVMDPYYTDNSSTTSDDSNTIYKTISTGELINSSNIEVYSSANSTTGFHQITNGPTVGGSQITTFEDLKETVNTPYADADFKGWYINFDGFDDNASTTEPSPRVLSTSSLLGGVVFTSVHAPGENYCEIGGESRLYALYYKTGTAYFNPILGLDTTVPSTPISVKFITLGQGRATSPTLHSGSGQGDQSVTAVIQKSNLSTSLIKSDTTSKVRSGKASWKQLD